MFKPLRYILQLSLNTTRKRIGTIPLVLSSKYATTIKTAPCDGPSILEECGRAQPITLTRKELSNKVKSGRKQLSAQQLSPMSNHKHTRCDGKEII